MTLPAGLSLIPTTVIGSHAAPGWFHTVLQAIAHGDYGPTDIQEAVDDAAALAIADQERAGIDIVSEGEVRRTDFIMGFYRRFDGVVAAPPHRRLGPFMYDSTEVYETAGRVTAPAGLGTVEEFKTGQRHATRVVKVAVAGPLTLTNAIRIHDGYRDRSELASDLAEVVAAELNALVDAGCTVIQVDEPSYSAYWASPEEGVALFNQCIERVKGRATVCLHVCFGNLRGRPQSPRTYASILDGLRDARADVLLLEFANREMAEAELVARAELPQVIGAGVVDVKSFHRERPEEVAGRLRLFLKAGVPPDRLWAVPDCGFWETPRWLCVTKLRALVAGAKLARKFVSG
jgi:5-methyltetrahydropteroyltriglutamate--homocysteine methyltransferase